MTSMHKTLIAATLVVGIAGCDMTSPSITDDGVYFGELTAANPRLQDGSRFATHTIALAAGEELNLTMQSTDFDAYLRVEDANGELVGEDDDSAGGSNANLILVAPEDATYTIIANTFSADEFGEYVLAVRRTTSDSLDGVFTGVLPEIDGKSFESNSHPRHEVSASAGDVIDVNLTSGAFDAYVEVQDLAGNVLAEDDDSAGGTNARVSLPIRADGVYMVVVKSFGDDGSGPYRLTVRTESAGKAGVDGQFEQLNGELTASSSILDDGTPYELHEITARQGEQLQVNMSSDAFDAYLQVWAEGQIVMAEDDDSGGGLNSQIDFVVPEDGRYMIVANSVGSEAQGRYEITVRRESLDDLMQSGKVEILSGMLSAFNDAFNDGTPTTSHEIEAKAGERLDISMSTGAFDAYLLVFDTDNEKLSEDDDSGGGTNARLSVIAPTDGTYRIVANSYDSGASGPYTITLRRD